MTKTVKTFCPKPLHMKDMRGLPFESSRLSETTLLDEESLWKMFHITEIMKRITPMYSDDRRLLWIEVKRDTPAEWMSFEDAKEEYDDIETLEDYLRVWEEENPYPVEWWSIMSGYYQDMHYIAIGDGRWKRVHLGNKSSIESENHKPRMNYAKFLGRLADYIKEIVDSIETNPDNYNSYLEANLPYTKRTGTIQTREYRRILGLGGEDKMPRGAKGFLRRMMAMGDEVPALEGPMTLRCYAGIWTIAHTGIKYYKMKEDADPLEVFSHSSKGYRIAKDYDLDSEEDYRKWAKENMPYHCFDIVYARVHLVPSEKDGKWTLGLWGGLEGWSRDIVEAGMALEKAGIPFSMKGEAESLFKNLIGDNEITFEPLGGVRSWIESPSRSFPEIYEEGVSKEKLEALAKATKWVPLKQARPIAEILQEDKD
ncbi:MAG: hypothetical protein IJ222_00355 [Bacteroidales bacterium]|nr:hypothetical protein [Bacteroidales bacterium]